jgi:hypothetical protein
MGCDAAVTSAAACCCPLLEVAEAEVPLLGLVVAELALLPEDEQLANTEQPASTAREAIRFRFAETARMLLSSDPVSLSCQFVRLLDNNHGIPGGSQESNV